MVYYRDSGINLKNMKKLLIAALCLISYVSYGQVGSIAHSGYFTRVQDSAAYITAAATRHAAGYADIWYSSSSGLMWQWNGSAYIQVGSGSGVGWATYKDATVTGMNNYTAFISGVSSYDTTQVFVLTFTNANTGSSDLDINGVGVTTLRDNQGNNLVAGDIGANTTHNVIYNGTQFRIIGPPFASSTARGIVSATTQSFAGSKTFTSNVTVNGALSNTISSTVIPNGPIVRLTDTDSGVSGGPDLLTLSYGGNTNTAQSSYGLIKVFTGTTTIFKPLGGLAFFKLTTADSTSLAIFTNNNAGTPVPQLHINRDGEVGIGLSTASSFDAASPSARLHVKSPTSIENETIFLVEDDGGVDVFSVSEAGSDVRRVSILAELYAGSSVGTSGHVLTSNGAGAAPTWEAPSGGTNTSSALTDGAAITITGPKHTLTSTQATVTWTLSQTTDFQTTDIILNATSTTWTFPAGALCVTEGVASGNNTAALAGVSGDHYVLSIYKDGTNYKVAVKNFGQ